MEIDERVLAAKFEVILPHLDEPQRRLLLAAEARSLGYVGSHWWPGQPLTSHEVAVNNIAGTTTRVGLTVHAERDTGTYPRGIKIPDREMKHLVSPPPRPARLARRVELHHHTDQDAGLSVSFISKP